MSRPASRNAPPTRGTTPSNVPVPPTSQSTNMIPYYLRPRPGAPSRQTITPQPTEQRLSIAAEQLRANQRRLQQEFQMLRAQNEQLMEEVEDMQTELSTAKSVLYSATTPTTHRTSGMERSASTPLWDILGNTLHSTPSRFPSSVSQSRPIFPIPPPVIRWAYVPSADFTPIPGILTETPNTIVPPLNPPEGTLPLFLPEDPTPEFSRRTSTDFYTPQGSIHMHHSGAGSPVVDHSPILERLHQHSAPTPSRNNASHYGSLPHSRPPSAVPLAQPTPQYMGMGPPSDPSHPSSSPSTPPPRGPPVPPYLPPQGPPPPPPPPPLPGNLHALSPGPPPRPGPLQYIYYPVGTVEPGPKLKEPDVFTGRDPTKLTPFISQCVHWF